MHLYLNPSTDSGILDPNMEWFSHPHVIRKQLIQSNSDFDGKSKPQMDNNLSVIRARKTVKAAAKRLRTVSSESRKLKQTKTDPEAQEKSPAVVNSSPFKITSVCVAKKLAHVQPPACNLPAQDSTQNSQTPKLVNGNLTAQSSVKPKTNKVTPTSNLKVSFIIFDVFVLFLLSYK